MKSKHLLWGLVSAFALSLSACSSDDDSGNSSSEKAQAYMTLQLVGPQAVQSRTLPGEDGTETGTTEENKITKVQVLLCNSGSSTIAYVYPLTGTALTETSSGAVTKPFEVRTGTYDVYVVANPKTDLTVGQDVSNVVLDDVTMATMTSNYAADNNFMMFSQCHGTDQVKGTSITITEANGYDNPATCAAIKLDRLPVKIKSTLDASPDITGVTTEAPIITAVSLEGFKLLNGATKTNLQQRWLSPSDSKNTNIASNPWNNVLHVPAMDGIIGPTFGYYNHITEFRTITTTNYGSGIIFTAVKDLYYNVDAYGISTTSDIYCMENNPSIAGTGTAQVGNTTGLVYQIKATVPTSDGKAGENCFYWYGTSYFATLEALETAYPTVFTSLGTTRTAAEGELTAAMLQPRDDQEEALSDFRAKYNIKVYKNGIMYYTYYIKDENYVNGDAADAKPYYSVMRNTIYNLTVKALQRVGTDVPGGWNPEISSDDPVDQTKVYMVVEAKVNPWVLNNQDITLK